MTAAGPTGRAVAAAILALYLFACDCRLAHAQQTQGVPLPAGLPYVSQSVGFPDRPSYLTTDGNICIVGYNDMSALLQALNKLFAAAHPGFRFRLHLPSTRAAPAALALGLSAFAPMGAEFSQQQLEAYTDAVGSLPQPVAVAHASLDPRALSAPLGIYVHRSNPLNSLTLDQAARIFTEQAASNAITTWNDLGLRGEWAGQSIHVLGLGPQTALGSFMQSRKFAARPYRKDFTAFTHSVDVIKGVAADVHSIGFADLNGATPGVKALAVASSAGSVASTGTAEDIVSGRYPLDRYLYIYVRREAGGSIEPWIREYLRLALSEEGQRAISDAEPRYLPLNPKEARSSLARLDEPAPDARPATLRAKLIICAGGETMQPLASHWGSTFHAHHPNVEIKVDTSTKLSADGFGALLDGRVSCVLMVREPLASEAQAFEHRFGHAPGLLRVATGSFEKGAHASVSDRRYPPTRSVYIAFDPNVMASPDSPLPDFLRYVLSPEAQRAIADDSEGFIPLPPNELEASRQSLASLTRWRCE
jgi:phosphate transport system substrate-binding protein